MGMINVQFADATEKVVVAVFGGPQDAETYQHLGQVDSADGRYKDFKAQFPANLIWPE